MLSHMKRCRGRFTPGTKTHNTFNTLTSNWSIVLIWRRAIYFLLNLGQREILKSPLFFLHFKVRPRYISQYSSRIATVRVVVILVGSPFTELDWRYRRGVANNARWLLLVEYVRDFKRNYRDKIELFTFSMTSLHDYSLGYMKDDLSYFLFWHYFGSNFHEFVLYLK